MNVPYNRYVLSIILHLMKVQASLLSLLIKKLVWTLKEVMIPEVVSRFLCRFANEEIWTAIVQNVDM